MKEQRDVMDGEMGDLSLLRKVGRCCYLMVPFAGDRGQVPNC